MLTNAEVRSWVLQLTDQWLQLTYSQVFIAVLVAILGIVNTLTVSIIDRKRELGVLRAVGGLRRQIRQTVWMEAVAIGLVGLRSGCCSAPRICISCCRSPAAIFRDAPAVPVSVRLALDAVADDPRCGALLGVVAGRVRRAQLARGGTGV